MTHTLSAGLGAALLMLLFTSSSSAQTSPVDGLGELREEVARARQQTPEAFARLEAVIPQVEVLDSRKRGTLAAAAPLFRQLGAQALWPMVERLVFDAGLATQPARDSAKLALQVGMVEATGDLRDARLLPLWKTLLEGAETRRPARRAAAVALAKLESPEAAALLITLSPQEGFRGETVREAMGQCRRLVVAQALADALARTPAPSEARRLAVALGDIGSFWAWKTSQPKAAPEEGDVRRVAAEALVNAWLNYTGDVQQALTQALMRVDAPETGALIQSMRARTRESNHPALEGLSRRMANNPLR
ncbi:hypothetical protein [Myxococcus sp. CA039A]|uniref:hypothetical protein n=1 Tax=Myxococcus sp. CA039A TaxID=2741737 RepID=UPI00157B6A24|nr:hypothetical protein [Myxococcus sp. CA039A]NTX50917.1 hypothetical protein [Myxococcus sp. CA039A]